MININANELRYSGNREEILQNFIDISFNIGRITNLNVAEINRLCDLIPSVMKNENIEEKKNENIEDQKSEILHDFYSEFNIKRIGNG